MPFFLGNGGTRVSAIKAAQGEEFRGVLSLEEPVQILEKFEKKTFIPLLRVRRLSIPEIFFQRSRRKSREGGGGSGSHQKESHLGGRRSKGGKGCSIGEEGNPCERRKKGYYLFSLRRAPDS